MKKPNAIRSIALLLLIAGFGWPAIAHAGLQFSGIKGRAYLEFPTVAPRWTNIVGISFAVGARSSSDALAPRSPVRTTVRIYNARSGRLLRTVSTDDSGRFRTLLPPGLYRLEPVSIQNGPAPGPGDAVPFAPNYVIQTAPAQTVQVHGNRFTPVTFVYRTIWPTWYPIRVIPSRLIRTGPASGPVYPVGTVPPPQPGGYRSINESASQLSGRMFPPLPPTPLTPPPSPPLLPPR